MCKTPVEISIISVAMAGTNVKLIWGVTIVTMSAYLNGC